MSDAKPSDSTDLKEFLKNVRDSRLSKCFRCGGSLGHNKPCPLFLAGPCSPDPVLNELCDLVEKFVAEPKPATRVDAGSLRATLQAGMEEDPVGYYVELGKSDIRKMIRILDSLDHRFGGMAPGDPCPDCAGKLRFAARLGMPVLECPCGLTWTKDGKVYGT